MQHAVKSVQEQFVGNAMATLTGLAGGFIEADDDLTGKHPAAPIVVQLKRQHVRWRVQPHVTLVQSRHRAIIDDRDRQFPQRRLAGLMQNPVGLPQAAAKLRDMAAPRGGRN